MNRRALIIALAGAGLFLLSLFGYYLPRHRARNEAQQAATAYRAELETLQAALRTGTPIRPRDNREEEKTEGFRERVPREPDIALIHEELIRLGRTTGKITVESITELGGREREENGVRKLPIRLNLRASYFDFARLLDAIDRAGLPLAVEGFTVSNRENVSPLSRIELTVAACAAPERDWGDDE